MVWEWENTDLENSSVWSIISVSILNEGGV